MAKVPIDIQDGIKKLSEKTKVLVPDLLKRLKDIIGSNPNIQTMEKDDFKIRFAYAVLYKEYASSGNAQECYICPLLHHSPRDITIKGSATTVCDCTALVQKIDRDEDGTKTVGDTVYCSGTFWREGAKNLQPLIKGKTYKTSLIMKENGWGFSISSDRATFVPVDDVSIDFEKFFEDEIRPNMQLMKIGDADVNEGADTTDIRVVEVTIMESDIDERDGREFGYYDVYDDSITGTSRRFFLDPRDVECEQGSLIQAGVYVRVGKAKDGTEIHRMNLQWCKPVPNLWEKKTFDIKTTSVEEDAIDISEPKESEDSSEDTENFEI